MRRQSGRTTARKGGTDGNLLDGTDAVRLLDIIEACLNCGKQEDFTSLFSDSRDVLPFDCALVLSGRLEARGVAVADGVSIGFPTAWIDAYLAKLGPQRDGVVKGAMTAPGIQSWCDAHVRLEQPNALALCRDFGLRSGYVAGLPPTFEEREGRLVCFGGASATADSRGEAVVRCLAPHLLLAFSRLRRAKRSPSGQPVVSPREKEVLQWLKQGKSSWDISRILGIRERTVNFHVANIMRKLGTYNRAQAVAAALHRQLIDFD